MRYLGIDFGSKRIGLALSDDEGNFVFPLSVLQNDDTLMDNIIKICGENKVGVVVVGESKDFAFNPNKIMEEVTPFVENIKNVLHIPVHLHPEFLTSMEAERLQGKNSMLDASAAALILKSYLETTKNK